MKKNKILRLASVMLMLCLITTCAISGTFASTPHPAQAPTQQELLSGA